MLGSATEKGPKFTPAVQQAVPVKKASVKAKTISEREKRGDGSGLGVIAEIKGLTVVCQNKCFRKISFTWSQPVSAVTIDEV